MTEPLVEAWRRFTESLTDPNRGTTGIVARDAFAAGWDAALSHPESDTREDADLEAWRQFTMDLADGKVSEKPNGLVREAFAYAWNAAHPESDTRGLDVERLTAFLVAASVHEGLHEAFPTVRAKAEWIAGQWNDPRSRMNLQLSASPDLSIDREADPGSSFPHRGSWRHAVWCSAVIAHVGDAGCSCGLDEVRRLAIRGTTQPEPTE